MPCAWDFEVLFPRTGFNCLIQPTASLPTHINRIHITFYVSLSFLFLFPILPCLYTYICSLFISLLYLSHPSPLAMSDLVSSAVYGVRVSGCDVMVVAAALMELAKWISRGIQRALSLITDPSARWRVSLGVHRMIYFLESFAFTS